MKKLIILTLIAPLMLSIAKAEETNSAYWNQEYARTHQTSPQKSIINNTRRSTRQTVTHTGSIPNAITQSAHAHGLGSWSSTLVRIAKIESGFRCSPGGNGGGLFQFSAPSRWGLTRASAKHCGPNINAAMRYAKHCINQGARTSGQMMMCWNSGSPHTSRGRLERAYRLALR